MQVKIAAIGREQHLSQLCQIARDNPDIEIVPFRYNSIRESPGLIEKAFMCDIYLFTEVAGLLAAKKLIEKKKLPVVHVPIDTYMVLSSLYQAKTAYENLPLGKVSIDVPPCTHIEEMLLDLRFTKSFILTYGDIGNTDFDCSKIVEHHKQLWEQGKINHVLTSLYEVHEQLNRLQIPNHCMPIPSKNIKEALEESQSVASLNQSISAQVVAAFIRIKNAQALEDKYGEAEVLDYQKKLFAILESFAAKVEASIFENEKQVVLFGTRSLLDYLANHLRHLPLLFEIEQEIRNPVAIGFGFGLTAKQAALHASLAIRACEEMQGSSCYIVNDRKETIGPLGVKKHFNTSELYHALIHGARLNNELSYSFIDFINFRNNEPFSSQDIAAYYQVTKRSAERTINKLLHGEVIKVVGKERPYAKGRPRKLFQINM
ncbi:hypothetical protein ACFSMW_08860 [Virgibacillus halophilus]|uniref:Transcriptional regulator n=1 Tax=Tigheibacillus halophilus TaxID=361280 RepID=A0ABU5C4T6_9BACI|nr:hypothetical protein [Virgibacillus halophilus]